MLFLSSDAIRKLLVEGRKTIATIVSIDYIKASDSMIEQNMIQKVNDMTAVEKASAYDVRMFNYFINENLYAHSSVHCSPLFRIRYSFNPPDDARSTDLIHEIQTHIAPEHHYKVGDPFPILYRIYRDDRLEFVDSMPFPLPLEDIVDNHNVFYHDTWNYYYGEHENLSYVQVGKAETDAYIDKPNVAYQKKYDFKKRAEKARARYGMTDIKE